MFRYQQRRIVFYKVYEYQSKVESKATEKEFGHELHQNYIDRHMPWSYIIPITKSSNFRHDSELKIIKSMILVPQDVSYSNLEQRIWKYVEHCLS